MPAVHLAPEPARPRRPAAAPSRSGLWTYEPGYDRLQLSDAWGEPLGYPLGGGVGGLGQLLELMPPRAQAVFRAALAGGGAEALDLRHEMRAADGRLAWVRTRIEVAQRDDQGRALRLVGRLVRAADGAGAAPRLH